MSPGHSSTAGPSDVGLPAERTALAWVRMGMSLLALPGALLAYAVSRDLVASVAAATAAVLGLALLMISLPAPSQVREAHRPATTRVILTGGAALLISVAALALVLTA